MFIGGYMSGGELVTRAICRNTRDVIELMNLFPEITTFVSEEVSDKDGNSLNNKTMKSFCSFEE